MRNVSVELAVKLRDELLERKRRDDFWLLVPTSDGDSPADNEERAAVSRALATHLGMTEAEFSNITLTTRTSQSARDRLAECWRTI